MLFAPSVSGLFKWCQFEPEVILLAVGWYLRFLLSYRVVEELLAERGLHADHVRVWRWVEEKTRNGILSTLSVNPPRKQRMSFRQRSVTYVKSFLRAFTREKRYPTCFKFRFVSSPRLEARSFRTTICERAFDENTKRQPNEPAIALCGFDKPEPRRLLEGANFARIIECGLGASIHDFDIIHIHNFPGRSTAADIWNDSAVKPGRPNPQLVEALSPIGEVCGALAIEVAGKAVSTSFIGAMASAAVFGELLRVFHKGHRYDEVFLSPRNFTDCGFVRSQESYSASEICEAGFCDVESLSRRSRLPLRRDDD
jgi:hypothetical protein